MFCAGNKSDISNWWRTYLQPAAHGIDITEQLQGEWGYAVISSCEEWTTPKQYSWDETTKATEIESEAWEHILRYRRRKFISLDGTFVPHTVSASASLSTSWPAVQFSSRWHLRARESRCILRSAPSLRGFPNVAFQTVQCSSDWWRPSLVLSGKTRCGLAHLDLSMSKCSVNKIKADCSKESPKTWIISTSWQSTHNVPLAEKEQVQTVFK